MLVPLAGTYNLNLFDMHGICIVYVLHITSIYVIYHNRSTLIYLVLAPVTSNSILIEQSINKKSIKNTRASHQIVSVPNMHISACQVIDLLHKDVYALVPVWWYSSACSSATHSVVWATVAL